MPGTLDLQEMASAAAGAGPDPVRTAACWSSARSGTCPSRLGLTSEPEEVDWIDSTWTPTPPASESSSTSASPPLRLDKFNACKSWLKPLEYSARGVYCVRARSAECRETRAGDAGQGPQGLGQVDQRGRCRTPTAGARWPRPPASRSWPGASTEHTAERWVAAWRTALDNRARSATTSVPARTPRPMVATPAR